MLAHCERQWRGGVIVSAEEPRAKDATWKKVLAAAGKCRSDTQLRGKMREYYHDHL